MLVISSRVFFSIRLLVSEEMMFDMCEVYWFMVRKLFVLMVLVMKVSECFRWWLERLVCVGLVRWCR